MTACKDAPPSTPAKAAAKTPPAQAAAKAATQAKAAAKTTQAKATQPPLARTALPDFTGAIEASPWETVKQVRNACKEQLGFAKAIKKALLAHKGPRNVGNTFEPFNTLLLHVDRVLPMTELIANVHPEKKVRTAAEKCEQRVKKFLSALKLNHELYEALKAVDISKEDAQTKRFVAHLLRDYRRSGVDRDKKTRKKLAALDAKMVKLGQLFSRNIREDKRFIEVSEKDLAGLPKDYIDDRVKRAKGKKIRITTDYPDFYPFETYAKNSALRKELYKRYLSRADSKNTKVLTELLRTRHAYATSLGYADWGTYNAEDKMVKKKEVIASFLAKVVKLARPRMDKDLKDILARKQKDEPKATAVGAWDRFYYVNKIKAERYGVDPAEVRAYFPFAAVKKGILEVAQKLFAVTFKKVEAKVWHASVEAYDVFDRGKRVARFYLDLHPRKGKYGHAAEFPILTGSPGKQLPAAALVTNFPDPSKGKALTEHTQVNTFFHEFGHLMHQLLSGRHRWVTQSGITCEWDFVEAPSQLLEEWAWDYSVLSRFARHEKTNKIIPKALVERMRKAKEFGTGVHVMRQMFYAYLSYKLHTTDPASLDLSAEVKKLHQEVSPYPHIEGSSVFANFGHLNGYSSMYYTYMWSMVMAKDLFTRFKDKGLLDERTALAYRQAVLEAGGSVDAEKMMQNFLERPYSFDAFRRWLQAS
ncbi:MAG: Zn-dependent oligopeptidase [Deltaproteobacteria bacterium]|nr:Zn-dependent oligopeptidase [Deltaproteobacteria bacterium]